VAAAVGGCGKGEQPANKAAPAENPGAAASTGTDPAKLEGPAAAVHQFLDAVRTGSDENASALLTTLARQKTAAMGLSVCPPATDTARFQVGKVQYLSDDGAWVAATWIDLDEEGQSVTDEAVWMCRKEPQGWRIAGVAATPFPDQPPVKLNFEDPEEMRVTQQLVREEMQRRMGANEVQQAQHREKPEGGIRR